MSPEPSRTVPASAFDPGAIAVVGASADPEKLSHRPVRYLQDHGFTGEIYPVNPNAETVAGLPAFPDIGSCPSAPAVAMVMVPAPLVVETVEDCFEVGVETVLVISSGFAETGDDEGIAAEHRLADLATGEDGTLIGPNSQGLLDIPNRMMASFTPALQREELVAGETSLVTQSGAVGGALATKLQNRGVGLRRWISTGNEADVGALDVIRTLSHDEETAVVAGYVEGFSDGRQLIELKRSAAGIDLPIVLLKVGRSERGKAAATSHTATLAGDQSVYDSIFHETGVLAVDDVDQLVDVVETLQILDGRPGERLGVVSTSGGAGVHLADLAERAGLCLPDLSGPVRSGIQDHIPPFGSASNPVDITAQVSGDPEAFADCLGLLCEDPGLDTVLLQLTNIGGDRGRPYAERIIDAWADRETPLVVSWMGGLEKANAISRLKEAGIPVFPTPVRCIRTIAPIAQHERSKPRLRAAIDQPARPPDPAPRPAGSEAILTEPAAKDLLAEFGIDHPRGVVVADPEEAIHAAEELGFPVVAKLLSTEIHHRAAVGGVRTGIEDPTTLRQAVRSLLDGAETLDESIEGITVQEQRPVDLELAAGIAQSDFGPVVMLGRGGTAIEGVDDAAFRTIPVVPEQAAAMLTELRTIPALDDPVRDGVVETVVALSECYVANPWIAEADVNPLALTPDGVVALDALVIGMEKPPN